MRHIRAQRTRSQRFAVYLGHSYLSKTNVLDSLCVFEPVPALRRLKAMETGVNADWVTVKQASKKKAQIEETCILKQCFNIGIPQNEQLIR